MGIEQWREGRESNPHEVSLTGFSVFGKAFPAFSWKFLKAIFD